MKKLITILFISLFAMGSVAQNKFIIPSPSDSQKLNNMIGQWNALLLNQISYAKSLGKTVEEVAAFTGDQFKTRWNKAAGYDGFVKHTLYSWVSILPSGGVEILEQSDNKIIIKGINSFPLLKQNGSIYNVTYEEYIKCLDIIQSKAAEYLGAKCSIKITDEGTITTIEKK